MRERIFRDSVFTGLLLGLISISLEYFLLYNLDRFINYITAWGHILKPPRLQSIILAANVILFRAMMINWGKPATGKGILLILICITGVYLYANKASIF